jgi:hypothetical protein
MWRKIEITEDRPEIFQWSVDERTASLAERRTVIGVDVTNGTVHLTHTGPYPDGDTRTFVFPPAAARSIGTALIEAGVIAGEALTR